MSWTHPICEACWIQREARHEPGGVSIRRPTMITDARAELCCFCGKPTIVGTYVRHSPARLSCRHD